MATPRFRLRRALPERWNRNGEARASVREALIGRDRQSPVAAVHASVHDLFNQEDHLVSREIYKQRRPAALAEWRAVMALRRTVGLGVLRHPRPRRR